VVGLSVGPANARGGGWQVGVDADLFLSHLSKLVAADHGVVCGCVVN